MYTAVPHAATTAPSSHMSNDSPTLPDDRSITLGVAKILRLVSVVHARDSTRDAPRPDYAVEDEERGAGEAELALLVGDVVGPFVGPVWCTLSMVAVKYRGRHTFFDSDDIVGPILAVVLVVSTRRQERLLLVKLDVEFTNARAGSRSVRHACRTRVKRAGGTSSAPEAGGKNRAKWRSDDA